MPRKLVALNLALAAVATLLVVYVVRQVLAPMPLPVGGRRAAPPAPPAAVETPRPSAGAYGVVAARNLFSPTRTEAPTGTTTAGAAPLVKPNLFGIVVRDGGSIAYIEDPTTKRVAGYRVGDKVVGGTVQTIKADAVVIDRPEGPFDVRLREPGRPRPAAAPAMPGQPGQPQAGVPLPSLPGVIPPVAAPPMPPAVAQPPGQPGQPQAVMPQPQPQPGFQPQPGVMPPVAGPPTRRPLPPNLLRRLPPGTGDAPQQ